MKPPFITVIIAVFNRAETLGQCIESVLKQTFRDTELIIVDGGSQDGSVEVIEQVSDQLDFWVSEPDTGIYDAWNKGLAHARGEWVCFLGADDYLRDEDVLRRLALFLQAQPHQVEFVYSKVMFVSIDGDDLFEIGEPWPSSWRMRRRHMPVPHPLMMHHRKLFQSRAFDASFRIAGDYEFFLRNARLDNVSFAKNITAVSMRPGGISSDKSSARQSMLEMRSAQKKNGFAMPHVLWLLDFFLLELRSLVFLLFGEDKGRKVVDQVRRILGFPAYWSRL